MAKNPEEQNIKSRARRRLIGAVALSLAVVVILPMVLDSEPKSTGQDIDLRIPSSDKVGEFVPGKALSEVVSAAQQAESVAAASAASAASAAAPAEPAVDEIAKFADATPAASPKTEARPAETRKPEARPIEAKKPEARPVETKKPEAKPVEAKKPEARPVETKKSEVKHPDAADAKQQASTTYIVQVGAFSNAGTATQEADKLKGWGFKAYTEFISGTTRVRVGPYTDRNKADEVRGLLEKRGLHPVVTAVKP